MFARFMYMPLRVQAAIRIQIQICIISLNMHPQLILPVILIRIMCIQICLYQLSCRQQCLLLCLIRLCVKKLYYSIQNSRELRCCIGYFPLLLTQFLQCLILLGYTPFIFPSAKSFLLYCMVMLQSLCLFHLRSIRRFILSNKLINP